MNTELINIILDKILENDVEETNIIKEQRKYINILDIEIFDNNKYVIFNINNAMTKKISKTTLGTMSIMFYELTQNIPIDCILHLRNGYIHSLEVYSCDGQAFETLDMTAIDVRVIDPA